MAYARPVLPGIALTQRPIATTPAQTGVQQTTLDVDVASPYNLGVVQVGSGLSITPAGLLSAVNGGFVNITLTNTNYVALLNDYYIGATKKEIEITLPPGVVGKLYVIKNQVTGNIKVKTSSGQTIDTSSSKILGTDDSITVIFDGTRWNIVN